MKINSFQSIADAVSSLYPTPIPLLDVATDEGICVIFDDYGKETFDGMTWYEAKDDQFFIHINTARGNTKVSNKGRFTLAHELGHYFIDHHRFALEYGKMQPHIHRYDLLGKNEEWEIEREADSFAANILMPLTQFKEDIRGKKFSGDLIQELALKYKVSFSACAMRYLKLNLTPIKLVLAENGKIKWQMHSSDFPFYQMRYGKSKVPENSVMGDYFYKGDSSCCKQSEVVYAGDCFLTFKEEQNNIPFYEYCIAHEDKAFSVFWEK